MLRYDSPLMLAHPVPEAVTLVVRAGDARYIEVFPSSEQVPGEQTRALRSRRVSLTPGPDGLARVTVPIRGPLTENWGDDRNPPRLARLRLDLPRATDPPQLVSVVFETTEQPWSSAPATAGRVALQGVYKPGWTLYPGGILQMTLSASETSARFVMDAGSLKPTTLAVTVGDVPQTVHPGTAWARVAVDLPEGPVNVRIENTGTAPVQLGDLRHEPVVTEGPNVLVYMVDTLRADHVGVWSDDPLTHTPTLDRLALQGARFARAQSTGSWTKPTVPTLMTGRYPMHHGVGLSGYADQLAGDVPTLQSALSAAGWRSGSFSASPLGSTLSGLDNGFGTVVPPVAFVGDLGDLGHPSADQLHDRLLAFIDEAPDAPWFAYVHTLEAHAWRNERYASTDKRTNYQMAVEDVDQQLSDLIIALHQRDELDDTVVVVVSDHGESFGAHDVHDHGTSTFQAQIHVPLIVWSPGHIAPSVTTDTVSLADVTPTVLDLLGLAALTDADGVSLKPYLDGLATEPVRDGAPSARLRFIGLEHEPAWFAWTDADGRKVVRDGLTEVGADLSVDACESALTAPHGEVSDALAQWRVSAQNDLRDAPSLPASATDRAMLSVLGYLP